MNINRKDSMTFQWNIRAWFVLILFLGLFAYSSPVLACSCAEPSSPASEFAQADAVFSGEVTRIRGIAYGYRIYFAVTRSWKGISTSRAEVSTGDSAANCGYNFKVGAKYVVYAYDWPNGLNAHICSRTAEVAQAAEDLSYLDTVDPVFVASTLQSSWRLPDILSLIVAGSLLFLATIWLLRRQRHIPL